jgi:hypothetical protein
MLVPAKTRDVGFWLTQLGYAGSLKTLLVVGRWFLNCEDSERYASSQKKFFLELILRKVLLS